MDYLGINGLVQAALTCFVYIIFLILPVTSIASSNHSIRLTLQDAVLLAMRFNPSVQSEDLQRLIDRITLETAEWGYAVKYSLDGVATDTRSVSDSIPSYTAAESLTLGATLLTPLGTQLAATSNLPVINSTNNPKTFLPSITFTLTQPLLRGFGPSIALAPLYEAQNTEKVNSLTYKNTLMKAVTSVVNGWLSYIQAQNSLKVQKLSLEGSLRVLKQQDAFLKAGRVAPADLIQFRATVASQRLSLSQQEVSLAQQKRALLITLGLNPDMPVEFVDSIQIPGPQVPPSLNESIQATFDNNPSWLQSKLAIKRAEIALHVTEDSARWQLNLTASRTQGPGFYNPGIPHITNGRFSETVYGLALNIPIDDVGLNNTVSQARIALHKQKIELEQTRRQLESTTINIWQTLISQHAQIKEAEDAVKLASQSLQVAEKKLKYGKSTPFEVSNLQTNQTTQEISAINVKISYISNLATLDEAIGYTLTRWGLVFRPDPGKSKALDIPDPAAFTGSLAELHQHS